MVNVQPLAASTGAAEELGELGEPFFLVGFQRSGTTLLRLMLNAHRDIAIPHDSAELWLSYARKTPQYGDLRIAGHTTALIDDLLAEPRIAEWQMPLPREMLLQDPLPIDFPGIMRRFHTTFARLHGKRIWGDKNTGTLTELERLNAMFPNCRVIHLVRDGRDCALSHLSPEYVYGYANVLRVAIEWREQTTLCHKMGRMLPPDRFLELRYEDLLAEPERELKNVCTFLDVAYQPEMLTYHRQVSQNVPEQKRSLWPLLDQPVTASNAYKWKSRMSAGDRAVFERNAADALGLFGYETLPRPVRRGVLRELWYQVHERIAWRFRS